MVFNNMLSLNDVPNYSTWFYSWRMQGGTTQHGTQGTAWCIILYCFKSIQTLSWPKSVIFLFFLFFFLFFVSMLPPPPPPQGFLTMPQFLNVPNLSCKHANGDQGGGGNIYLPSLFLERACVPGNVRAQECPMDLTGILQETIIQREKHF